MKYLVLNISRFDFTKEGGERFQGVRVTYLDQQPEASEKSRGLATMTISGAPELWDKMTTAPGYYDLDFKQKPDFKGRPTLSLVGATLIAEAATVA